MNVFLSVEDVIKIHDRKDNSGFVQGGRGKLESAVGQPQATWAGEYLYPTLMQQAASLLFCVCNAHAFGNGNKRVGWYACVTFLDLNGVQLAVFDQRESIGLMDAVADLGWTIPEITDWLLARL